MDLSVIILNYNTKGLLRDCLKSVLASTGSYKTEVIVADNGSADGSIEMVRSEFPQVKLLENGRNLGFAKGNNEAIKMASGRHVMLLNSDTVVKPDAFEKMISKADSDPMIGALGPKILLANGQLDPSSRRNFPNPANSFFRLFGLKRFSNYNIAGPVDQEMEVESIMGACMLVPRTVIEKVGMLDEEFFFYGEDLDWCYRIKEAGYKVVYYPAAQILHLKSASSRQIPFKIVKVAYTAMKIFYRKHYAPKYPVVFNWLVYAGINLRMYLVMFINLFRKNKSVH
ncbi:MAG TPA: glycosyltransferase family 2 protein [Candidatus Binatia bacterium]|nr:glycosyltransferase family 2 protein [Candidatus Binatia bacterium]